MCEDDRCTECSQTLRLPNCEGYAAVIPAENLDACKAHAEAKDHFYLSYDEARGKCFSSASCSEPVSTEARWDRTHHPEYTRCERVRGEPAAMDAASLDACFALASSMNRRFVSYRADVRRCRASETCIAPETHTNGPWAVYEYKGREAWTIYTRKSNVGLENVPVSASYPAGRSSRCTLGGGGLAQDGSTEVSCPALEDAMSQMVGDVEDAVLAAEEELRRLEKECAVANTETEKEEISFVMQGEHGNAALAHSTAAFNAGEEHERLATEELRALTARQQDVEARCDEDLKHFEDHLCAIRQMRLEVLTLLDEDADVQDCAVGEWLEEPCTEECGGGEQKLSRDVIAEPSANGAPCPPLELRRPCNDVPCPKDCQVDVWSEWSQCSKACGQGVRQRVRSALVEPQSGGEPCPNLEEGETCNAAPCDRDCEYTAWSEPSGCSQRCGGGWRVQTRAVFREAVGNGLPCAAEDAPERLKAQLCNEHACEEGLTCDAERDLVFLLDASGSVSSEEFDSQKAAVDALLERITFGDTKAKVGAVLFGTSAKDVSALTTDKDALSAAIGAAAQDVGWTTHLGAGLSRAQAQLLKGRASAPSIVIGFLNGMPSDARAAAAVSADLAPHARVLLVPVGSSMDFKKLGTVASFPTHANVLGVHAFSDLATESEVTRLVASICVA